MGVEHDISDCTFDELCEELFSRCTCAILVTERESKISDVPLYGHSFKGSQAQAIGLLIHSLVRVLMGVVLSENADEREIP